MLCPKPFDARAALHPEHGGLQRAPQGAEPRNPDDPRIEPALHPLYEQRRRVEFPAKGIRCRGRQPAGCPHASRPSDGVALLRPRLRGTRGEKAGETDEPAVGAGRHHAGRRIPGHLALRPLHRGGDICRLGSREFPPLRDVRPVEAFRRPDHRRCQAAAAQYRGDCRTGRRGGGEPLGFAAFRPRRERHSAGSAPGRQGGFRARMDSRGSCRGVADTPRIAHGDQRAVHLLPQPRDRRRAGAGAAQRARCRTADRRRPLLSLGDPARLLQVAL